MGKSRGNAIGGASRGGTLGNALEGERMPASNILGPLLRKLALPALHKPRGMLRAPLRDGWLGSHDALPGVRILLDQHALIAASFRLGDNAGCDNQFNHSSFPLSLR